MALSLCLSQGFHMRPLALCLLLCCTSCFATSAALDRVNVAVAAVEEAVLNPEVTQAELDAVKAEAAASAEGLKVAVKEDAQGILSLGKAADGGAIGLALTAAAWLLRDRRKRLGKDPLQDKNISTPPTTT